MKIMLANFTKMVNDTGGMAKVTVAFANEMVKRGHDVSLVYSDEKSGDFYYPVSDQVKCIDLRFQNNKRIKFPLLRKIKRELYRFIDERKSRTVGIDFGRDYLSDYCRKVVDMEHPDVIVSFNPGTSALLLCASDKLPPLVTMSHGDPEDYFKFYPYRSVEAVKKSTINQVLLPSFSEHLKNYAPECRIIVIGNAIPQFEEKAKLDIIKNQYKVIFVARLAKSHKRPHLLINAFALVAEKHPDWILELWGAKDNKTYYRELELLVKSKGLSNRVFFKGVTNDVPSKLREADILAFPSSWEGFSLALGEGMSMGLPSIGYKNSPSVNELIVDGVNGILVEDGIEDFGNALDRLMSDRQLRVKMGQAASQAMKYYAPENIWNQWEDLLCKLENHKDI